MNYPLFLLALITLTTLFACSPSGKTGDGSIVKEWKGEVDLFKTEFQIRHGLFHDSSDKPYSGRLAILNNGVAHYEILVGAGRPLSFKDASGRAVSRWSSADLWVGTDAGWEVDFEERADGIFHNPSGQLFSGRVISIDDATGHIQVEYNYTDGIPHGPEIYFNANHEEASRQVWIQGKIPYSPL
ncbi:MAG: hypothetical protein HN996_13400 [Opitutae bacterium]|nr:hypothetical protein [Opitutae bacterium]